jgi:hypothetical protein
MIIVASQADGMDVFAIKEAFQYCKEKVTIFATQKKNSVASRITDSQPTLCTSNLFHTTAHQISSHICASIC